MSAGKQPSRLGVGEFDGGQLVPSVRQSFLLTTKESARQVLEELWDETLQLFVTAKSKYVDSTPRRTIPQVEQLRKKIIEGTIEQSEIVFYKTGAKNCFKQWGRQ